MATTINFSPGLRVILPEGIVLEGGSPQRQRGPILPDAALVPMPVPATSSTNGEARGIADALAKQDMVMVGAFPLKPSRRVVRGEEAAIPSGPSEVGVEVAVDSGENAAVLLEQDGLYTWHFDGVDAIPPAEPTRTVQRGAKADGRTITFRLSLEGTPTSPAKTRSWLSDLIVGQAQAFVFKFAGRFLLGRGAAFLERKIETGFVVMDGNDPSAWGKAADFSEINLPKDRRARILLFVHGTFSSTRGGFAALAATPWGRSFLESARANYDAVVGFDHPTLSVDPLVNATALLRGLEARTWDQPAAIDGVSHSRGGITLRSLIEELLPAANLPLKVERAVFVGAVNGGTELAEPKNWRTFIDIYTNIAAGACRAIAMFPQTTFVAMLTEEMLKSVGVLVKVLVNEAVTGEALPGLAAMEPSGRFITELNQTQPGQPTAKDIRYYAITSEFQASLALGSLKELPGKLVFALANGAVNQVMGKANDLVVNTDSMTHIDPEAETLLKDTLAFGQNGIVYHTNYFLQPQATNAMARWFELEAPKTANPARRRGLTQPGMAVPTSVPARVDTDILLAASEDLWIETLERIRRRAPSYVVVERDFEGKRLLYAFRAEEVAAAIPGNQGATLQEALNLRETDASPQTEGEIAPQPRAEPTTPSSGRTVVLGDSKILGVAEIKVLPTPLANLVEQAQNGAPQVEQTGIVRRSADFQASDPTPGPDAAFLVQPFFEPAAAEVIPKRKRKTRGGAADLPPAGAPLAPQSTPRGATTTAEAPKVACNFLAEMDDEVVVGEPTGVDVTLSRELVAASRAVAESGAISVDSSRKLTIEIIPKKNFLVTGDARVDVDLPKPDNPDVYAFDLMATDVGEGEVLVRMRQGMQPLSNLLLRCRIAATRTRSPVRRSQEASVIDAPPQTEPLHQLTITEIERGGKQLYQFIFDSPTLNLKDIYESPPLVGSREDYVKAIYKDIEGRYLSTAGDSIQFGKELREVGAGLWDDLIPEKLQKALWERRENIQSILVFSEEPFVPWELVHLKEPGKGLPPETRFLAQMGLVRWLHNVGWPPTELRARKGRCRYVIPNYPHPSYVLEAAQDEAQFLKDTFGATPVEPHTGPVRDLLEAAGSFDLLHFACHGIADSGDIARAEILLEGRVEGANYVTEKFRVSIVEQCSGISGADGVRPMVTLNACQAGRAGYKLTSIGGFSRAFLKQGAGMFCAALWSVGDEPAQTFTETLYKSLKANDNLAEATIKARNEAANSHEATWLAYTVYGNPHAKLVP